MSPDPTTSHPRSIYRYRAGRSRPALLPAMAFWLVIWLLSLIALAPQPALAQFPGLSSETTEATDEPDPLTAAELEARKVGIEAEISDLQSQLEAAEGTEGEEATTLDRLNGRLDALRRLRRLLDQQRDALARNESLRADEVALDGRSATAPAGLLDGLPPFAIAQLDRTLDRRDAAIAKREAIEASLASGRRELEVVSARLDRRESERRRVKEALEVTPVDQPEQAAVLRAELELAELESQAATAEQKARELEVENFENELEIQTREVGLWHEAETWVRQRLEPTAEDDAETRDRLTKQIRRLRELREQAAKGADEADDRLRQAQEQMPAGAEVGSAAAARVQAEEAALRLAREREDLLDQRLQRFEQALENWSWRYDFLRGELADPDRLAEICARLNAQLEQLERDRRQTEAELERVRAAQRGVESKLADAAQDSGAGAAERWLRRELEADSQLASLLSDEIEQLERFRVAVERPFTEMDRSVHPLDWRGWAANAWRMLGTIWSYEITSVQDNPITTGQVVFALLLLVLGYRISRFLSRLFAQRFLTRFRLDRGALAALQTMLFYLLLVLFFIWALQMVRIPLTVFTVLGGALAIGVGFGSQNVVNNFISGLILLVERPVKAGDLIDVDGVQGRVEHIGPRSTRIRSGDNTHIIVPNSSFLEGNVLNWTVSDNLLRFSVSVGVAYGSPTAEVTRMLHQALEENDKVLPQPPPEVLFEEFGDNSLLFNAYFWTEIRQVMDRKRVQSALRYRIDELFNEAGIVIAFPQRDVHLDTLKPLEVRVVGGEKI